MNATVPIAIYWHNSGKAISFAPEGQPMQSHGWRRLNSELLHALLVTKSAYEVSAFIQADPILFLAVGQPVFDEIRKRLANLNIKQLIEFLIGYLGDDLEEVISTHDRALQEKQNEL